MQTTLTQQIYLNTPKVPLELCKAILDNLDELPRKDQRNALKAGALTCTLFRDICQPKLFEVLRIPRGNHFFIPPLGHPASSLLAILQGSPHLRRYIKAIHISSGGSTNLVSCGVCDRNIAAILALVGHLRQLVISSRDYSDETVVGLRWRDLDPELNSEIVKRCQSGAIAELSLFDVTGIPYTIFYPPSPSLETLTLSSVEHGHQPYREDGSRHRRALQRLRGFNTKVAQATDLQSFYHFMKSPWWALDLACLVEFTLHIPGQLLRNEVATFFCDILHKCLGTVEFLTLYVEHPDGAPLNLKEELALLHQATCLNKFELRASLNPGLFLTSASALQSIIWYTSILSTIPVTTKEVDIVIEVSDNLDEGHEGTAKDGREEWDQLASTLLHLANTAVVAIYFLVMPWSSFDGVRSRLHTLLGLLVGRRVPNGLQLTVILGQPGLLWWKEMRGDILDSIELVEPVQAEY